nr:hypothetical protein [Tanacetum cinerariifolium]
MVLYASDQSILCLIEIHCTKERLLCTFIHAETMGRLGKQLWADLSICKTICNNNPWVIMGDLNVCLNIEDYSGGISYKSQDMEEFHDCGNRLNIDDVASSGLYPAFIFCSNALKIPSRSFRFANYVADKEEFKSIIEEKWNIKVEGFAMFKLVKKLKAMKPIMNNLNWKNVNLYDKGMAILGDYFVTLEDEEKLMFQRAKDKECMDLDAKIFKNKINQQDACNMIREVYKEEIKEAMFSIDDNKARGPDGYTGKFYKKAWDSIGGDVLLGIIFELIRQKTNETR